MNETVTPSQMPSKRISASRSLTPRETVLRHVQAVWKPVYDPGVHLFRFYRPGTDQKASFGEVVEDLYQTFPTLAGNPTRPFHYVIAMLHVLEGR